MSEEKRMTSEEREASLRHADYALLILREEYNAMEQFHIAGEISAISIIISEIRRLEITGEIERLGK